VNPAGRQSSDFKDNTQPEERTFGFYEVQVPSAAIALVFRVSHPTACKLARGRTRYGDTELFFLEPIDTPAIN
jgi:hypothetical protein